MGNLTNEQVVRLNSLIQHLETFPIAELMVASGELRLPRPLDENSKKRFRHSLGGAFAIGKIGYYLHSLREVDNNRLRLGKECRARLGVIPQLKESDPVRAIELEAESTFLSGIQEVTYHFFAICVAALDGLLPMAAKAAGYKIPSAHQNILHSYVPLRDYFEHLENRLPGKSYSAELVTEHSDEHRWHLALGFHVDEQERIIINGKTIDVTSRGLSQVEDVIATSYEAMRESCLKQVHAFFTKFPEEIPSPDQVSYKPLVSMLSGRHDLIGLDAPDGPLF